MAVSAQRNTPVEPALGIERARRKTATKLTPEGLPVHSFATLLGDLAGPVPTPVRLPTQEQVALAIAIQRTALQPRAFDPLGTDPPQNVPITVTG